jgi:hypothetical protein
MNSSSPIFSLVLTFLTKGHEGIVEFSRRRFDQFSDAFYINPKKPKAKPAVTEWFTQLRNSASGETCSRVMCESLDFLLKNVLISERKRRLGASQIEARLQEIWHPYSRLESPPTPNKSQFTDNDGAARAADAITHRKQEGYQSINFEHL